MTKYWVFYRIRDDNYQPIRPIVYAFAFSKSDKDLFKAFRDMNMFYCEKHDDIKNIAREFPTNFNRDVYRLKMTRFRTINEFGLGSYIDVQTTCDEEEKVVLYYDKIYSNMLNHTFPSYKIFNKSIRNALKVLQYDELYSFSKQSSYLNNVDDSIKQASTIVDEFAIFMQLYGKTVKSI